MKIFQIPRRFVHDAWGGTETVILETSKCLAKLGHETVIACPDALSGNSREVMDGIEVRRFPYCYPYFGLPGAARAQLDQKGGNLFSVHLMHHIMREADLDIIHLHTGKRLGGIGRFVARRRNIPYVVSLHGGVYDVPRAEAEAMAEPVREALEWGKVLGWMVGSRRVLQDADAILCVGREEQRQVLQRFPDKRVLHLPNGVDPEYFFAGDGIGFRVAHKIPLEARVLLIVGRIDPQKNQLRAVEILRDLLRIDPTVHLLLVGSVTDPVYRAQIDRKVADLLQGRVTLIPGFDRGDQRLVDAYHAADVFWLPSRHEPFGIVLLEAWASGLPVVGAPVGGITDIIAPGIDGMVVNPDETQDVVHCLTTLLQNAELRRRLANAGRSKVHRSYSWDRVTQQLVNLYTELLKERKRHVA